MKAINRLLVTITVISLINAENMIKKAEKATKDEICSVQLIDYFVKRKVSYQGTFPVKKANKQIKSICPTLTTTCCSYDQVNQLKNIVLEVRPLRQKLYEMIRELKTQIEKAELSTEKININMIPEDKINKAHRDYFESGMYRVEDFLNKPESYLEPLYLLDDQIISSFYCQICNPKFIKQFEIRDLSNFYVRFNEKTFNEIHDYIMANEPLSTIFKDIRILLEMKKYFYGVKVPFQGKMISGYMRVRVDLIKCFTIEKFQNDIYCKSKILRFGLFLRIDYLYNYLEIIQESVNYLLVENGETAQEFFNKEDADRITHRIKSPEDHDLVTVNWKFYFTDRVGIRGKEEAMNLEETSKATIKIISFIGLLLILL